MWHIIMSMSERAFLRLNEVAELLGVSPQAVRMLVYRGSLPAFKLGGRLYIRSVDLQNAFKPVGRKGGEGREGKNEREV